jgi:hypothetical protein
VTGHAEDVHVAVADLQGEEHVNPFTPHPNYDVGETAKRDKPSPRDDSAQVKIRHRLKIKLRWVTRTIFAVIT